MLKCHRDDDPAAPVRRAPRQRQTTGSPPPACHASRSSSPSTRLRPSACDLSLHSTIHPPASLYPSVSVIRHQKREGWKTLKKDIPSIVREVAIVFKTRISWKAIDRCNHPHTYIWTQVVMMEKKQPNYCICLGQIAQHYHIV